MDKNEEKLSNRNVKFEKFLRDKEKKSFTRIQKMKIFNKFDNIFFRNSKLITMGGVEFINNVVLHIFDTIKVRIQAKSMFHDISKFHENKINEKSN